MLSVGEKKGSPCKPRSILLFDICVGGFFSTEEGWLSFESAWNAMLRKHGLGGVLHMADFHGKRTKKQEGMVLEDLTKIIVTHLRVGLSTFVDMQAYRKVNDLYALEEGIGTPYAIAARGVAKYINEWKTRDFKSGDHLLT